MIKKQFYGVTVLLIAVVSLGFAKIAIAQNTIQASVAIKDVSAINENQAENSVTTTKPKIAAQVQARITKTITTADKEIGRRVDALNKLGDRLSSMKRIAETDKQALNSNLQNQISILNSLKTKIDSDESTTTLKADIKSIADSYRIFILVIPQGRILASVDSLKTTIDLLTGVANKLQTRITDGQTVGKDVSKLTTALADMNAKISDARTQSQAARDVIAPLVPDNGDKTVLATNNTALKNARADIKTAGQDLMAARKDADTILKGLKTLGLNKSAGASSTAPSVTP